MARIYHRGWLIIVLVIFTLVFSAQYKALSAPLFPRDNPEFWNKFSSIILMDPAREYNPLPFYSELTVNLNQAVKVLGAVPVGPNVLTNQDLTTQAQNEPSIDVNPSDPNHVIASSNDYRLRVNPPPQGDVRPGYYISFDGGVTWTGDGIIDLSPIPNTYAGGDPAIAIHDMNNVYYSYLAFNRDPNVVAGGVAVSKSIDGGLTWQDPVVVAWNTLYDFHDKEYIAVDATGSPYDGNVYVTWTLFGDAYRIYFSRSTNGGATFSNPIQISDPNLAYNQGSLPAVGPDGTLYVAWYNYDTSAIRMVKSTNGGQSFGTPFHVASVDPIYNPLPGGDFRDNSFPTMAVDPTNGNIYVAWSDMRNDDADIYFSRSTNGGSTWSAPVRINDDALHNLVHQFFPWMDVSPNGKLYVGWFDSRLDPTPWESPLLYDEYVTVSTDGGITFSPNQRISEQTSDSSIGGFATPFIGDYSGLAATNNFVYPAWVDTRRNQEDIFTQHAVQVEGQKAAPDWVEPQIPFTYTISLLSAADVPGNQLDDPLPSEVTYVPGSAWSSSGTVDYANGHVTWIGDISAGTLISITFEVTPTATACTPITNAATLTTGFGSTAELTAESIVTGTLPVPEFSWSSLGLVFTFTNETTGTTPLDYLWNFGDGITSTLEAPTHTFAAPGEYTVNLVAANNCGTQAASHVVTATCSAPQAGFTWQADGLLVSFTDLSNGYPPFTHLWNFGDGSTSDLPSPTHLFPSPGRYTTQLTLTDICGTDSYQSYILAGKTIFLPISHR